MADSSFRSLAHLQETASTARVLNLLRVWRRSETDSSYLAAPFFKHPMLNRALIVKHRLRRHELELFHDGRQTATKILIPIDNTDLRLGGWALMVGQANFEAMAASLFGNLDPADRGMLDIIDELPSLDPFLLREHLKRFDRHPARVYFEISDSDMARMVAFVEQEIQKLVDLCYSGAGGASGTRSEGSSRLVQKILSIKVDKDTEPLRLTLRLAQQEYQEGVFCWKGFLYYKWTLLQCLPQLDGVLKAIVSIRPRGPMDTESKVYLNQTRDLLRLSILRVCEMAQSSIDVYDHAFNSLVGGQPQAFREFLLGAPAMFTDLGERLGAVNHIVSFWNYRFPAVRPPVVTVEELIDIFGEFEASLAFNASRQGQDDGEGSRQGARRPELKLA